MTGLTPKQVEAKAFIAKFTRLNDAAPTYDQIREGLGLANKSGVHRLIVALERRGHLRRIPNCARAVEVISVSSERIRSFSDDELIAEVRRRGL